MLRTSSYTILVDLPNQPDELLLIHGFSGAFDKVSRPVGDFLRARSRRAAERDERSERPLRAETVESLKRRGYLTEKSHDEEEAVFSKLAEALIVRERGYQPGYVIVPTYSCNLRCPYCFQHHMRTDPAYSHLIRTMSPEVADRILATLPALEERHNMKPGSRPRSILFFGGEPLLALSRPIVEHIYNQARSLGPVTFGAITNATEIDAYRDLLGEGKIASLQITLDGPPAEHDKKRIYADGAGSFDKITANIAMALDLGARVSVRLNMDSNNMKWLPLLSREVEARGWSSYSNFNIYVAPVHPSGTVTDRSAVMDSWSLKKSLAKLREDNPALGIVGHADDGIRRRLRQIFDKKQNPMPGFKAGFCSAQTVMYIFDAFEDVYACWEHMGDPKERVAHINPDGELAFEPQQLDVWRGRSVLSNPRCRRCRYAFYCGGGCANLAWRRTGDFHTPDCDGFARRFHATAAQAYAEFVAGKTPEPQQEPACDR